MTAEQMRNGPKRTILDIQEFPGQPWRILDVNAEVGAYSGGRQPIQSEWGRDERGDLTYLGTSITGNPERFTFNVSQRVEIQKALQNALNQLDKAALCGCDNFGVNLRTRIRCGDIRDVNNYDIAVVGIDAYSTSQSTANNLANSMDGNDQIQSLVENMSAGVLVWQRPLVHNDIKGTINDVAFNDIKWKCDEEYWAVTDGDDTPGYLTDPTPLVFWTTDKGLTWDSVYVGPLLNGDGLSLVIVGANVLVASPTIGVAYAPVASIKNGVDNPNLWALSTGFVSDFPNRLTVAPDGTVWAVGDGGYVWKSADGGFTFSEVSAATVTTEDLHSVHFAEADLGWIGGENGTLLKYYRGTLSAVSTGIAAQLNDVAVPSRRTNEVYFATDTGLIYRSNNALATTPTFTSKGFPMSGNGQVNRLLFVGFMGQYLFVLQSDADDNTRVLRDNSGGDLGASVEIIGDFQSPENNGINAIAMATPNQGLVVGEVEDAYGYIGSING